MSTNYLMIYEYRPEALGDYNPGVRAVEEKKAEARQARTDESYIQAAMAMPSTAWVVGEDAKNQILRSEAGVRAIELSDEDYATLTRKAKRDGHDPVQDPPVPCTCDWCSDEQNDEDYN